MPLSVTNLVRTVMVVATTNRWELHSSVLPERFSSQSEPQSWPIAGADLESVSREPAVADASTSDSAPQAPLPE
jgi:hypothetical protein